MSFYYSEMSVADLTDFPARPCWAQSLDEDADSRCSYPSKRCDNPKSLKLGGTLHRFCEFHREKANANQRRLQQKRKARELGEYSPDRTRTPLELYLHQLYGQHDLQQQANSFQDYAPPNIQVTSPEEAQKAPRFEIGDEDLQMLATILCVDDAAQDDVGADFDMAGMHVDIL